ncbi:MAG: ribonuclease E/G [Paracoccaceae bacterium]
MIGRVAAIERGEDREMAALMVDGELHDLLIDPKPDDMTPRPGAIYRAVLDRTPKGMHGALVKLPDGQSGFLKETKGIAPGAHILVQVNSVAEPGKAAPVTRRILFKSRFAIVTPGKPGLNIARSITDPDTRSQLGDIASAAMQGCDETLGLILRSACLDAAAEDIAADIAEMRDLAEAVLGEENAKGTALLVDAPSAGHLAWRDWSGPDPDIIADGENAFADHNVWEAIEALKSPRVVLAGGAWMSVEATRALVAVDVNTGGDFTPAAALKANIAAARALPRQLRLRGFGGQIVIDFAPGPKRDRAIIEQSLTAALRAEGTESHIAGWTPLGHCELQRKRDRRPLSELL